MRYRQTICKFYEFTRYFWFLYPCDPQSLKFDENYLTISESELPNLYQYQDSIFLNRLFRDNSQLGREMGWMLRIFLLAGFIG